jgi:hypothetical protein
MITITISTASPHWIGYARAGSVSQDLDSQMDALRQAGCGNIFSEKMTGSRMVRPASDELVDYVQIR